MSPLLSIGIPVYNGQNFLQATMDSILAQTFKDFEVIICDNCSTDQTGAISKAYAAADSRVHYYLNEKNIGAARNYDRVFSYAKGKYFKWAAHDDLIEETYLERCIQVLESDPTVVLCHAQTQIIDEHGQPVDATEKDRFVRTNDVEVRIGQETSTRNLKSPRSDDRFGSIVLLTHWCYDIFGVMRTDTLRRTHLEENFYGTDKVLLSEMSLLGRFVQIPEPLFLNRRHPTQSGSLQSAKARERWNNPLAKRHHVFPRLLCLRGYVRAALENQMSLPERLGCFVVIGHYLTQSRRWRNVIHEYAPGWLKNRSSHKQTDESATPAIRMS